MRWLALAAGLLAACADGAADPLSFAIDARGPFEVGYRTWELTYQPPGGAPERTIAIDLWYPTEDTDGYNPTYMGLFRDDDAFEDAAPAPPAYGDGYPVHVYSHGFRGFGGTSADLMGYFASHGWLAVAPSHTDNLLFDDEPLPTAHYFARSTDITAALDALAGADLPGAIALDRVLLSGHSFGAYTAWATAGAGFDEAAIRARCEAGEVPSGTCTEAEIDTLAAGLRDPRIAAIVPMAGGDTGWFGADGYGAVDVPVFYMTGTDDDVGQQALFDAIEGVDLTWIDVAGGCHQLFGLGGCQSLDDATGFAIVNTYALAFARRHLLGDDGATTTGIVDGTVEVSNLVRLERKPN